MTAKPGIRPADCNDSNHWLENLQFQEGVSPTSLRQYRTLYLAFQKTQQTLSVESLNPPDTQVLAAHFSLDWSRNVAPLTVAELTENTTCKNYLQVRPEGARQVERNQRHHNLAAILAVG